MEDGGERGPLKWADVFFFFFTKRHKSVVAHTAEVFILAALLFFSHVEQRWRDEEPDRPGGRSDRNVAFVGGEVEYVWQNINGWIISRGAARNSYGAATENLGVATKKGTTTHEGIGNTPE